MTPKMALAAVMMMALAPQQAKSPPSVWLTNMGQAFQEARRTGKPLFVVFRCQP